MARHVIAEHKYHDLKSQLQALNYLQPLGIESAPLVEKLLEDLVMTTESYRNLERRANKEAQSLNILQGQVLPLKNENSRLIRENNKLHQELIHQAEVFEKRELSWQKENKKQSNDAKNATFLRSTDRERIKQQENEIKDLRKRVQQLLDRNLVAKLKGDDKKSSTNSSSSTSLQQFQEWQGRKQEIAMSSTLPANDQNENIMVESQTQQRNAPDPSEITQREIKLAERLKAQSQEAQLLREELSSLQLSAKEAKSARDQEINRLSKLLEVGRPLDEEGAKLAHDANLKLIDQLQDQVDFLNEQLSRKAAIAEKAEEDIRQMKVLKTKYIRANNKLSEGEKIAHALNERIQAQKQTIQAQQDALARLASTNAQGNVIGDDMKAQLVEARSIAKNNETDANTLRRKLERVATERAELQREVESYKHRLTVLSKDQSDTSRTNERSQAVLRDLQLERDTLRKEIDALTTQLKHSRSAQSKAVQECDAARADQERESSRTRSLREEMRTLTQQLAQKSSENMKLQESLRQTATIASLPQVVADMRDELGRARERCTALEISRDKAMYAEKRNGELVQRLENEIDVLKSTMKQTEASRQKLRKDLVMAEARMVEAEGRATTAEADRDEASRGHARFADDLQARMAADKERMVQIEEMGQDLEAAREVALVSKRQAEKAVELERDVRKRMQRLETELQKVQFSETNARKEASRLSALLGGAEKKLQLSESNHRRVENTVQGYKQEVQACKDKIRNLETELNNASDQVSQLRALVMQTDATRERTEDRLQHMENEIAEANELTDRARGEANAHKKSLEDSLRTIRRLENVIKELDAQKDAVEMKLDTQAEIVAKLKSEKQRSKSNVLSHQKQLEASSRQVESLTAALQGRDREVRSLQNQLEDLSARYTEQGNAMQLRDAEMAAMTQDLANMTTENQSVNEGAGTLRRNNKALASRLDEALVRAQHAEQLCRRQEKEREDVTKAYRVACEERARLEQTVEDLAGQRATMTLRLQEAGSELAQLRGRLREESSGTNTWRIAKANYERQLAELGAANEVLSRRLRRAERAGGVASSAVEQAREATQALASTQNGLRYDNAQLRALADEARTRIEKLQATNATLQAQYNECTREKNAIEDALANARVEIAKASGQQQNDVTVKSSDGRNSEITEKNELIASLREQIKLLNGQVTELTKERDQLTKLLNTAKNEIMEQERRSQVLKEMANKYEKDLDTRSRGGVTEGKE